MPSSYAIGPHFESFIKSKIESGRYQNASEVVRDALRLLEKREEMQALRLEKLRSQIQQGQQSGEGIPAENVFSRLEAKFSKA